MLHKLLVRCFFFLFVPFSSNLAILYYSDYRPRIINIDKVLPSQAYAVSNASGVWALALYAI
jgi:hypothetical protein